jgi:ribosomal-protein-alanine N-acetyltransferase
MSPSPAPPIEAARVAPPWVDELDRALFGAPWGPPGGAERLWLIAPLAYARWSVVPAAGEAELLRVAVSPAARRRGLGAALLRAAARDLAAAGVARLYLEVRAGNEPARRLYERDGWRVLGLRAGYYPDGEDAMLYGKELPGGARYPSVSPSP